MSHQLLNQQALLLQALLHLPHQLPQLRQALPLPVTKVLLQVLLQLHQVLLQTHQALLQLLQVLPQLHHQLTQPLQVLLQLLILHQAPLHQLPKPVQTPLVPIKLVKMLQLLDHMPTMHNHWPITLSLRLQTPRHQPMLPHQLRL
jgi:hypothetical protein